MDNLHQLNASLSDADLLRLLRITTAQDLGIHEQYIKTTQANTNCKTLKELLIWSTSKLSKEIEVISMVLGASPKIFHTYSPVAIPSAYLYAETLTLAGSIRIVIHEGLLSWLSFVAEMDAIISELSQNCPQADELAMTTIERLEDLYLMLNYSYFRHPFVLPCLSRARTTSIARAAAMQTLSATAFILLHEISHARLGHLRNQVGEVSSQVQFVIPESASLSKQQEYEADIEAVLTAPGGRTGLVLAGAEFLLAKLAMYENFTANLSESHPMAINRLSNLATGLVGIEKDKLDHLNGIIRMIHDDYSEKPAGFHEYIKLKLEQIDVQQATHIVGELASIAVEAYLT